MPDSGEGWPGYMVSRTQSTRVYKQVFFVGLCWFPLKDTLYFFVLSILRIRKQLIKDNACKDLVVLRSPSIEVELDGIGKV